MASTYKQSMPTGEAHFSASPESGLEFSRMTAVSRHITTINAGDIVPIYCKEILPSEELTLDLDSVIRESTMLLPVMGQLYVDFYAFFVPNRVVNKSWKEVQGENSAGVWSNVNEIELAPLAVVPESYEGSPLTVQIPVGSVADYYGFPTQQPIPVSVLAEMNDLKFRGYIEIYNEYFRDQNYQPPIPYSKLNVYEGFFGVYSVVSSVSAGTWSSSVSSSNRSDSFVPINGIYRATGSGSGVPAHATIGSSSLPDGSFYSGAVMKGLYGGGSSIGSSFSVGALVKGKGFSALGLPLKANRLHDYFTSVLPSPQKGVAMSIMFPSDSVSFAVPGSTNPVTATGSVSPLGTVKFETSSGLSDGFHNLGLIAGEGKESSLGLNGESVSGVSGASISSTNLKVTTPQGSITVTPGQFGTLDINQLRTTIAVQQVYELLARGGTRYREFVKAFFGVEVDDPYKDIPEYLGHIRRELRNYQVAQTSASVEGGTAQGNLTAYGYTNTGGRLFHKKFLEHGYVHVFAVIRHKNLYSSMLSRDNFRRSQLDYYMPLLANLSEQPVYVREINPFYSSGGNNANNSVFGYQEAWAEYRYEPDRVSGLMRPGTDGNIAVWNMADDFSADLSVATGS